ncbi:MAG: helix-turn-helix transcriptional regulator [Oscillospiraceae bacterium]|nr:helix-turn-helix transcriptional regulator [Oscillospiraceae bacterium]
MDCLTCRPVCGTCGPKNDADGIADIYGSPGSPVFTQPRREGAGAGDAPLANGFTYVKCKFCGSIIVHRVYAVSQEDEDEYFIRIDSDDPPGIRPAPQYGGQPDGSGEVCEAQGGAVGCGAAQSGEALSSNARGGEALSSDALGGKTLSSNALSSDALGGEAQIGGAPHGAQASGPRLCDRECDGICIQYDTGSCGGSRCKTCEVHAAGLCCKRYLLHTKNSNMLERDGGDYRNLMGGFIKRRKDEGGIDEAIKLRLDEEASRSNAYRDRVRANIVGAADANLIFEWREYTLDDLIVMFPHVVRRPVRIEIQLLIYLFHNYRFPIDLEHAESRFRLPKFAINRYLRAYYGYTYSSLLAKIRNEHSKFLLRIPLLRISEVGALVGYKSLYHYSLNFKRYEGISPKEYRQSVIGIKNMDI